MSNTDSEKLRKLAEWVEDAIDFDTYPVLEEDQNKSVRDIRKCTGDFVRRIASDLETLQAANEIMKSELQKWMDMGYKELEQYGPVLSKPFAPRSPLDTLNEYNEAKKLQSERDYYKELAEAADMVIASIEHPRPKLSIPEYMGAKVIRDKWQHLKNNPPK